MPQPLQGFAGDLDWVSGREQVTGSQVGILVQRSQRISLELNSVGGYLGQKQVGCARQAYCWDLGIGLYYVKSSGHLNFLNTKPAVFLQPAFRYDGYVQGLRHRKRMRMSQDESY